MSALTRRRFFLLALAAVTAAFSGGCGQKGPLYIPEESGEEDDEKRKEAAPASGSRRPARV